MAEEKYLRQYEKSAAGNYLLKQRGLLANVITTTADRTLTEESGSIVFPELLLMMLLYKMYLLQDNGLDL